MLVLLLSWAAYAGDAGQVAVPAASSSVPSVRIVDHVLAWSDVGFAPAAPESKAIGPERLAAGPDGRVAMFDPVGRRVLVLRDGRIASTFPAALVDDLAFTEQGDLLLLAGRQLVLVGDDGTERDHRAVPDLVPTGATLLVDGGVAWGVDPFGNRHPIASVTKGLETSSAPLLVKNPHHVVRDVAGRKVTVDGVTIALPSCIEAGVHALGQGFVEVDAVTADHPLAVDRFVAWGGNDVLDLDVAGRVYAPERDAAVSSDGTLVVLMPRADGLHVVEVTP